MRNNPLILSVLAGASFLIAGCAVTPTIRQVHPIEADLSRYSAIQVIVDAPENVRKQRGYANTAADLLKEFIAGVVASGKYATVGTEAPTGKGLEARLTITELNYVSGASRGLIGAVGGEAILNVTMTLKDNETATVVGIVTARHTSGDDALPGVGSAVTSRQISAFATELSSRLSGR
jgi:hypothetical protein